MDPPVNHTRRSWTDNGVHYTVHTTSYASSGLSFRMNGATTSSVFSQPQNSARSQGSGLLGTAFGLLGDVLAARRQPSVEQNGRRSGRQTYADDLAYGDDEYSDEEQEQGHQPSSFISNLA